MTYKVILIYYDGTTQIFQDVFSLNICGSSVTFYDIKEIKQESRDGKELKFIQIKPNEHTIVRKKKKA